MKRASLALLLLAAPVLAGDNAFNDLARGFESQSGARRVYIPFLGLANFFVKVARPAGAKEFRLAVFENVSSAFHPEQMNAIAGSEWRPLVRVWSGRNGETTYIYASERGKDLRMLIAAIEHREATIIQMKVNPDTFLRYVNRLR